MAQSMRRETSTAYHGIADIAEGVSQSSPRSSPVASTASGSDKENTSSRNPRSSLGKRKTTSGTVSFSRTTPSTTLNKRQCIDDRGKVMASQAARRREIGQQVDNGFYDPDQDESSKRHTTRRLRELNAELNDSRAEYLQRGSKGIQHTIRLADELIRDVKQTSTATIDSRLLVSVGDLAYKKINTMTLGDSSTAIDVDDFLSKCISYMKAQPDSTHTQSSQRRQQRLRHDNNPDDDDEDQEVDLDWACIGRSLCFPAARRPCLSSFLLGPLSLQKKVRAPTQRRATQRAAIDPAQLARPTELDEEALGRKDNYSLTKVCAEIASLLEKTARNGQLRVEQEVDSFEQKAAREATGEEVDRMMRQHHIRSNGGVPLFDFCVNPQSFGQTVENFFYVSFLVKEGRVGLSHDDDDMPTLSIVETKTMQERQENVRNQAVFSLNFEIWEELVQSFGLKKSVIPHRNTETWENDDGVLDNDITDDARLPLQADGPNASRSNDAHVENIESDDLYN